MADITDDDTPLTLAEKYFSDYDIIIIEDSRRGRPVKLKLRGFQRNSAF
jgi:hypothetical protein